MKCKQKYLFILHWSIELFLNGKLFDLRGLRNRNGNKNNSRDYRLNNHQDYEQPNYLYSNLSSHIDSCYDWTYKNYINSTINP
jgi:hypothetical protein